MGDGEHNCSLLIPYRLIIKNALQRGTSYQKDLYIKLGYVKNEWQVQFNSRTGSRALRQLPAHCPPLNYYLKRMPEDYRRTLCLLQLRSTFFALLRLSFWLARMKTYWPLLEQWCTTDLFWGKQNIIFMPVRNHSPAIANVNGLIYS